MELQGFGLFQRTQIHTYYWIHSRPEWTGIYTYLRVSIDHFTLLMVLCSLVQYSNTPTAILIQPPILRQKEWASDKTYSLPVCPSLEYEHRDCSRTHHWSLNSAKNILYKIKWIKINSKINLIIRWCDIA